MLRRAVGRRVRRHGGRKRAAENGVTRTRAVPDNPGDGQDEGDALAVVRAAADHPAAGVPRHQGDGVGTEMRAAVLPAQRRHPHRVRDALGQEERFVLDRDQWRRHRRFDVAIEGLEPCLPLFGAG